MPETEASQTSLDPGLARNPRLFVLFRIFFNNRFYYPVYALMFIDFGLKQEQFATLNLAWAIAIVVLEVPSGALADQIGRRPLVIWAAVLMIIEMLVMLLMPVADHASYEGNPDGLKHAVYVLFAVFMVNRVISGAAEAAASGADEALAYDSLPEKERDVLWSKLTTQLMKWQSISFIIVTLVGAAVYDPQFLNKVSGWLGFETSFIQVQTLKIPIALTLVMAVITLFVALRTKEPPDFQPPEKRHFLESVKLSFARTFKAGGWILHTPAALMLLLVGLFFDSIVRLYYTVGSLWLSVIGYQPAHFGVISVAGSIMGIVAAMIGERLILRHTPNFNFRFLTLLVFIGILSLAFPIQYWSVLFLPALWIAMRLLHFFLSNYLNRVTDAENRATVLSFRGLSMNLTYGILTWLYGVQTVFIRKGYESGGVNPGVEGDRSDLTNLIFADAAKWWWVYLAVVIFALWAFRHFRIGKTWNELLPPAERRENRGE